MSKFDKVFHVTGTGLYLPVGYVREVNLYTGETSDFGPYYGEFPLIPCCLVDGQQAYFVCCPESRATTWDASRMPLTDMKISYNGTNYYVCAGYNPSSTSEPIPDDPDPDPYTYTYTSYTAVHLDGITASASRPTSSVTYLNSSDLPWSEIYTSDWYKTIYEVTRDDGVVKYCNSQDFNDTIEDGWWHMCPIEAAGKSGNYYLWEAFYCWSFVDGYRQTYGGGYEIIDRNGLWDTSQQSLYPEASRQLV